MTEPARTYDTAFRPNHDNAVAVEPSDGEAVAAPEPEPPPKDPDGRG